MRLTTPLALLLGLSASGFFVAIAVFFALRANYADANSRLSSLSQRSPTSVSTSVAASAGLVGRGGDARREAARALAIQHDQFVATCFTPLAKNPPEVGSVSFHVRVAFDEEGKQATKYEILTENLARIDITQCVGREIQPIVIPKDVAPATVDIPLILP
jgi:hypothetical protein